MNAIKTKYRGYEFRSRIEAKWACMFDQFGWRWEYEPIDLNGYIPDFVLRFPHGDTIVEIKSELAREELLLATEKIERSGWESEAMILGSYVDSHGIFKSSGLISARCDYDDWAWDDAIFHLCKKCSSPSVHHMNGRWHCRRCGAYDGDRYVGRLTTFDTYWAQAHNKTKWTPRP